VVNSTDGLPCQAICPSSCSVKRSLLLLICGRSIWLPVVECSRVWNHSPSRKLKTMALRDEFERSGNWLFRWRSYLPLLLTAVVLIGMIDYKRPVDGYMPGQLWEIACLAVSLFGLGIRVYTIGHTPAGTSGRNTRKQVAESLNSTGIYSVLRHPLYVGNYFCWLGISMFAGTWWVSVIFTLVFMLYYERIMFAEEEFLRRKFGEAYESWAEKTAVCLPRFRNWKPSALPFSTRSVLKREYSGFFAIIVSFTLLKMVGDLLLEGTIGFDLIWAVIFSIGLVTYVTLRTLKRNTQLLSVEGR